MAPDFIDNENSATVLPILRASTRAVHQRLHSHPLTRNLVRRSLSAPEYLSILHALHRFHCMIESELSLLPHLYPDRSASIRLKRDYQLVSGEHTNPLVPCPALNLVHSVDSTLGLLYVLEGSRQGGTVIAMNIKKTLGLDKNNGAAFFASDGETVSADWNDFILLLKSRCSNPEACSRAALKTFLHLEKYLWTIHRTLPTSRELSPRAVNEI